MNTPPPANNPDANRSESDTIPNHPLADIIGKFEGEIWEATLEEIQRLRRLDLQYCQSRSLLESD